MRLHCIFILAAGCLISTARAQDTNFIVLYSNLEIFEAQIGKVIVKAFADVGSVLTKTAILSVKLKESTDASSSHREYGIAVGVKEENAFEHLTFVDFDELESFIAAIDYLMNIDITVTTLPNFQAIYRTRADLRLLAYSSNRRPGTLQTALQTSRNISGDRILFGPGQLAEFKALIVEAKAKLDALKSGT